MQLRDGRKILGELLSFDQYSNIVVNGARERKMIGLNYYDESLGLYIIRGENVVLIGDQHPSRLSKYSPTLTLNQLSKEEFNKLEAEEKEKQQATGGHKSIKSGGEEDDIM